MFSMPILGACSPELPAAAPRTIRSDQSYIQNLSPFCGIPSFYENFTFEFEIVCKTRSPVLWVKPILSLKFLNVRMMVSSEDNYFEKKIVKTFDEDFWSCDEDSRKTFLEGSLKKRQLKWMLTFNQCRDSNPPTPRTSFSLSSMIRRSLVRWTRLCQ